MAFLCPHAQEHIRLNCRHISTQSGLSGAYTRKVLQDPYGFMWIATEDGLNRYDGRNIIVYNKGLPGRHAITGTDIWDLALDSTEGLIWAINAFGGIDAIDYHTGYVTWSYSQVKNKTTANLRFVCLSIIGSSLYIGSTDGLFILDTRNKQLEPVPLSNPFTPGNIPLSIEKLISDALGNIWLFCREQGILVLKHRSAVIRSFLPETVLRGADRAHTHFYDCELLKDGSLLAATNSGLKNFSIDGLGMISYNNDPFSAISVTHNRDIYSCRQDKEGNTWFCASHCLARISRTTNRLTLFREHTSFDDYKWLDAIFDISFDKDNNLWLGCQQGLLYAQNRLSCFTSINRSLNTDALIRHAYYINPLNDSILYCCAQNGLFRVNRLSGSIVALTAEKPFYHAFDDPSGKLIASCNDGTFVLDGHSLVPLTTAYPEFRPLKQLVFNSHCYIGDSLIVFGTENYRGIIVWNYRKQTVKVIDTRSPGLFLKENTINAVRKDTKGLIWVLGDAAVSILDFRTGRTRTLNTYDPAGNKSYSIFFDLCEIRGRYYLASYGSGVLVLDTVYHIIRELTTKDGLTSNSVYQLLPYRDSLLFVTSNNGLSSLDLLHSFAVRKFYAGDGLHSDYFEENSGATYKGILYAGGLNGLTAIDPARIAPEVMAPGLRLRQVSIETKAGLIDSSDLRMQSLDIPNDAVQTTLYFSAFHYSNPDRVNFSYRIKELHGGWIDMGKRDFINFIGQNPGTYTLQVRSAVDGIPAKTILELSLDFLPHWYQTWWFKALLLMMIIGFFYGFYRYRIQQLDQQQKIRRDIASDLHDDLGSTLNTVKIYSHLARREQEKDTHLERIEDSITQAALSLRDLIWVLDEQQDTVRELLDRIKKFALPLAQASNIRFESHIGDEVDDKQLSKTAKRNLLLIFKEAINNSFKYASCNSIKLEVTQAKGKLSFTIHDDGKGFDGSAVEYGHGLKNIRQRAGQIKYAVGIISAPGKGTTITLEGK